MQDRRETVILLPDARVRQFALAERHMRLITRPFHDQRTGLLGQVDQVQQLGNRKVPKISA